MLTFTVWSGAKTKAFDIYLQWKGKVLVSRIFAAVL